MALIKCPECGKEISDKAISCPNCGYPVSQKQEKVLHNQHQPASHPHHHQKGMPTNKILAIIFSVFGCILLIGIVSSIFLNSVESINDETQIEEPDQEEIQVVPDTAKPNTNQVDETQPELNETNDAEGTQNSIVDAFKQGFEDNFNISEENQENIDSIQESVSEIVNDEEVQEAYEGWKESLNELFGGE